MPENLSIPADCESVQLLLLPLLLPRPPPPHLHLFLGMLGSASALH